MTDPFNSALENLAKYDDIKFLKHLFKNYYNLKKLGEMGNQSAITIYMDLEWALNHHSIAYCQRKYIKEFLINKEKLVSLTSGTNLSQDDIYYFVNSGLLLISRVLEDKKDDNC